MSTNIHRRLITKHRFSTKFCRTMHLLGIKTVGQANTFLSNANPNTSIGTTYFNRVKINNLQIEIDSYISSKYFPNELS